MRAAAVAWLCALAGCCGPSPQEAAALDARAQRYAAAERAYARRHDPDAFEAFAAIAADPAFDAATRALARHRQGAIRLRQGQTPEARRLLASVADFGVPERAALAALDAAEAAPDARGATLDVIRSHPDTAAAEVGVERLARGCPPAEAPALVATLTALAEAHPDTTLGPVATRWRAYLEVEALVDLPAARRTLWGLVQRWPESHEAAVAMRRLAELEERRGAWVRARATWDALAGRHPDRGWLWMGSERGIGSDAAALSAARITLHHIGDLSGAVERYRDAIDDFGDGVLGDDMRFELAVALFAADRPGEARDALRALLDADPESRHAPAARAILDGGAPPALDALRGRA